MTSSVRRLLLRGAVSLVLLAVLAAVLDPGAVLGRLSSLRPGWAVGALALSVLQVAGSAWRWRFTAARLGIHLPLGRAVEEYYLATFLNQVLPGGVLGDVSRAWRHARETAPATGEARAGDAGTREGPVPGTPHLRAVNAVVLERLSGQGVMTGVAVVSVLVLALPGGDRLPGLSGWWALAALVVVAVLAALVTRRLVRVPALRRVVWDARAALLQGRALPVQLATSLAIVASYLAIFLMGARAVGVETPVPVLLPLAAPVLVTMLLPVTVAGWGVRETAAAALWGLVGLTAADGVAVSVVYGLLVLISSLPGAAILLLTLWWDRQRR